jgi:hypothetical protein
VPGDSFVTNSFCHNNTPCCRMGQLIRSAASVATRFYGYNRRLYSRRSFWGVLAAAAVASVFAIAFMPSAAERTLMYPTLTILWLAVLYTLVLWRRDRRLPVFEIGTLWVASTTVYAVVPFFGFIAMGQQWTHWTDNRLQWYEFNPGELASFGWRQVVYILAFIVCYLCVRKRYNARSTPLAPVSSSLLAAIAIIFAAQEVFKLSMSHFYGLDLDVSYADLGQLIERMAQTPLLLLQVTFVVLAAVLLIKQAVLIMLIRHWRSFQWRVVLLAWLAFETVSVIMRMGGRGEAVRLLLSFAIVYDRFVRPLRAKWLLAGGSILLAGFLIQGHLRGFMTLGELTPGNVLTTTNEFQALFGTAFDLYKKKQLGTLPPVPWQIYWSDAYIAIPQQLLPFDKIDPTVWYLSLLGYPGSNVGLMFGVMSQAVLGFDWIELAIRGAVLGLLFGAFHRWYVRHVRSFWATLLYLFVTVWSYYTYRATSLWILHFVVYQFLPVFLAAKILEAGLSRRLTPSFNAVPQTSR